MDDIKYVFPHPSGAQGCDGMTLRDYFAGQALSSIPLRDWGVASRGDAAVIEAWANCAYAVADAMMKRRDK